MYVCGGTQGVGLLIRGYLAMAIAVVKAFTAPSHNNRGARGRHRKLLTGSGERM